MRRWGDDAHGDENGGFVNEDPPLTLFIRDLPQAVRFPISGRGLPTLIASGVIFAVFEFFFSFAMGVGTFLAIALTGYVFLYLQTVMRAAAEGEDEMPFWPDMLNLLDMTAPLLRYVALLILCCGPAVALATYAAQSSPIAPGLRMGVIALSVAGGLYFPMALLGLTISSNWEGLLPHIVIPSIVRSIPAYLLLCATLAGFGAVAGTLDHFLKGIPVAGALVRGVLSFYELGFLGFALGRFYRAYEGMLKF